MKLTPISFSLAKVATRGLGRGGAEVSSGGAFVFDDDTSPADFEDASPDALEEVAEGRDKGGGGGGEAVSSSFASNRFT